MFDYVLGYISNLLSAFPCLNSSNFPFFKPKKLSSRNIHPGIITKRIQPITFLGNAILKPFLFFRLPSLIYPSFHLQISVSFSSSASGSAQSCHQNLCYHSFSQPMCLGLTSAYLMSWSSLSISGSN